jgi:hypothetical protein
MQANLLLALCVWEGLAQRKACLRDVRLAYLLTVSFAFHSSFLSKMMSFTLHITSGVDCCSSVKNVFSRRFQRQISGGGQVNLTTSILLCS